jgi:hypothetical protein
MLCLVDKKKINYLNAPILSGILEDLYDAIPIIFVLQLLFFIVLCGIIYLTYADLSELLLLIQFIYNYHLAYY